MFDMTSKTHVSCPIVHSIEIMDSNKNLVHLAIMKMTKDE